MGSSHFFFDEAFVVSFFFDMTEPVPSTSFHNVNVNDSGSKQFTRQLSNINNFPLGSNPHTVCKVGADVSERHFTDSTDEMRQNYCMTWVTMACYTQYKSIVFARPPFRPSSLQAMEF